MRMDGKFFTLAIAANLAAELMGLYRESSFHVDRLCRTQHNLIIISHKEVCLSFTQKLREENLKDLRQIKRTRKQARYI